MHIETARHSSAQLPQWRRAAAFSRVEIALPFFASIANAGECPADKTVMDGQGQKPGPATPGGTTDTLPASTGLRGGRTLTCHLPA